MIKEDINKHIGQIAAIHCKTGIDGNEIVKLLENNSNMNFRRLRNSWTDDCKDFVIYLDEPGWDRMQHYKEDNNDYKLIPAERFLTKVQEEIMTNKQKTPGKTYLEKLNQFQNNLTQEEMDFHFKRKNSMSDIKLNDLLKQIREEVNNLFNDSENQSINKNDITAILVEKVKIEE